MLNTQLQLWKQSNTYTDKNSDFYLRVCGLQNQEVENVPVTKDTKIIYAIIFNFGLTYS